MSEMKRAARGLVEARTERFESRHALAESRQRLQAALTRMQAERSSVFVPRWSEVDGRAVLEARFEPPPRTLLLLKLFSAGMTLLVAASVWAVFTNEGTLRFALPLFTGLAVLAMPFVALGLGSQREAHEARLRRAIRTALLDEPERMPPAQRWDDEED
jgi:hypothetical protein